MPFQRIDRKDSESPSRLDSERPESAAALAAEFVVPPELAVDADRLGSAVRKLLAGLLRPEEAAKQPWLMIDASGVGHSVAEELACALRRNGSGWRVALLLAPPVAAIVRAGVERQSCAVVETRDDFLRLAAGPGAEAPLVALIPEWDWCWETAAGSETLDDAFLRELEFGAAADAG